MNLYEIRFKHYAPKGEKEGILLHLYANSDEAVYEWIKSEPKVEGCSTLYNSWKYKEDEEEGFKERIIDCCGDMYDDYSEVDDLYYGATQYGWKMIQEDVHEIFYELLKNLGINRQKFTFISDDKTNNKTN